MTAGSRRIESVEAELAFTRPDDVSPDDQQPHLLRAKTLAPDALLDGRSFDRHLCRVTDCSALDDGRPSIREHGFTYADLSSRISLQAAFERVRVRGEVSEADAAEIRARLRGASLPLADGRRLRLLFIAPEGFLMRRAGPNGLSVNRHATSVGMNDHAAAMAVHADQDVTGTPVRQILRGLAPWLLHHDSPGRANSSSPLVLVNIWVPLQQVTRPLALMDRRTLDRRRHQLRYGLPTDAFLERDEERKVNDIWTFLHDERQRWYFTSELDSRTAYVFDTLSTPHAAFVLPGEARAELLYLRLCAALHAIERRDEAALSSATREPGQDADGVTRLPALQRAIDHMEDVLTEARIHAGALARGLGPSGWSARARRATDQVVRKSLEMRAVGLLTRGLD